MDAERRVTLSEGSEKTFGKSLELELSSPVVRPGQTKRRGVWQASGAEGVSKGQTRKSLEGFGVGH